MLAAEQPDLVTVCLPNEVHFAPTLDLVRRGVPLLVEKPLVFDSAEAAVLVAEAAARGVFFAINFNHRYAEAVQRAKAAIDEGRLGEIVFATWRFGGEPNFGTHPHANLIETQCHGLDMMEHLVGPIASVTAQMTDQVRPGTYTTLAVALAFASGAVGTMLGSYDSSYAYPGAQHLEVNGTLGRALVEDTVAGSPCPRSAARCTRCGRRATSTTRVAASTRPSTGTSTRCWTPCAPAPSRPSTRVRGSGPWTSRPRSSRPSSPAPGSRPPSSLDDRVDDRLAPTEEEDPRDRSRSRRWGCRSAWRSRWSGCRSGRC